MGWKEPGDWIGFSVGEPGSPALTPVTLKLCVLDQLPCTSFDTGPATA
jgi:hypothetical protein